MAAILTIIPYQFYPPQSGGALRCFFILREMARKHSVCVLTTQPEDEFIGKNDLEFPPNVEVVSIHQKKKYTSTFNRLSNRLADALNYRILTRSFFTETNSFLLAIYPTLKSLLKERKFDIVYYENLEVLGLVQPIVKRNGTCINLYDAHNVDTELWKKEAANNPDCREVLLKYSKKAEAIETRIYKKVEAFFCCSENDNKKLSVLNKYRIHGIVVPNGVDITSRPWDRNDDKYLNKEIIFCGSLDYFPNYEGLHWFYTEVFPIVKKAIASVKLTIIGSVSQNEKYNYLLSDKAVNFVGKVHSVVPFYTAASVSIVPLLSGSGTRLKILEAMSLGNPVVSTAIGAEGIAFENGKQILIADDPTEFAKQISLLLQDKEMFNNLRASAYELVKLTYDWRTIGVKINDSLEAILIK